jgi:hypothetical protein
VGSSFGELQASSRNQVGNNSGDQNLSRLGLGHHASRCVNGDATNIAPSDFDFTCVQPCPQWQTDLVGCRAKRQRASYRASWTIEGRKDAVAGGLDQIAAMFLDSLFSHLIVSVEQSTPRLIPHLGSASCGINNVREQDGSEKTL